MFGAESRDIDATLDDDDNRCELTPTIRGLLQHVAINIDKGPLKRSQSLPLIDAHHIEVDGIAEALHFEHIANGGVKFIGGHGIDQNFVRLNWTAASDQRLITKLRFQS